MKQIILLICALSVLILLITHFYVAYKQTRQLDKIIKDIDELLKDINL